MKNNELLELFNKVLVDKKIPFQFSNWEGVINLKDEELSFLFNKISDLLTLEGLSGDGELNKLGIIYDEICSKLSNEMTRRPGFKLDISNNKH